MGALLILLVLIQRGKGGGLVGAVLVYCGGEGGGAGGEGRNQAVKRRGGGGGGGGGGEGGFSFPPPPPPATPPPLFREVGVLLSMTGYGEARHQSDTLSVAVELRAVNNRHLKVVVRATEPYNLVEPEIEKTLRKSIRRGTIQVHIRCERQALATDYRLNT